MTDPDIRPAELGCLVFQLDRYGKRARAKELFLEPAMATISLFADGLNRSQRYPS